MEISKKEIQFVVLNLPTNKTPGPDGLARGFYLTLKAEAMLTLHRVSQQIKEVKMLFNSL
jgi:hypothetical protein